MKFPDDPQAPSELPRAFGGKGRALAVLAEAGFAVPPWFAVAPEDPLEPGSLAAALAKLGGTQFAVRSSGAAEDGAGDSFAGQFESHLHVPPADVAEKIAAVRQSARSEAILAYCRERGLNPPGPPTALVQKMIDARAAGVAFSADPVSGDRSCALVSAVEGIGEALVSGEADGENWRFPSGGIEAPDTLSPVLTPEQAAAVADLARRCEAFFHRPQDIEWAFDRENRLWLLQSRPITTLGSLPDPSGEPRVWDNANIAESYGGVTTPLTFSFARRIYEHVYREFCRLMSVPSGRIRRADEVFPNMLGLIRGRTYYNLNSWYRVLALLPGFQVNRGFMEQMMGVREPMPPELVEQIAAESRTGKFSDTLALIRCCFGLGWRQIRLPAQIRKFQQRLDRALAPVNLSAMSPDELATHYRDLERQLLRKWDAPLVNDFFAMIHYGLLRGLCRKWAGDKDGTLQNELLTDTGEIISAEPARRIHRMSALARETPGLPQLLMNRDLSPRKKQEALGQNPALAAEFDEYLEIFGDRCLEELKLESLTVRDDPGPLLLSIGALAQKVPAATQEPPTEPVPIPKVGGFLKRFLFRRVLNQARERVRCRENLRFERTRLFGRVRGILRELGARLYADGRLENPAEVFYLELSEILAARDGTETTADLAGLARLRRADFEHFENTPAPPDRFESRGPVYRMREWPMPAEESSDFAESGAIQGVGACPGIVRGRVRVILDPRGAALEPGEILVARQTDPGWVVLFPAASGLLVERGSLLSHSAIVSRELRLPCVVSLPGITTRLRTGNLVEMNGGTGQVRILAED